jgi:hypothetical protein
MDFKTCNICGVVKPIDDFLVNHRRCKECQYEINKTYSKLYYQQHKARLIKLNKINYKIRNPNPNKNGRPKIYNVEEERVLSC